MNNNLHANELIQKYLDGLLSAPELAELQQLLCNDTTIADTFYAAACQEEQLRAYFCQQRDSACMEAILNDVLASSGSHSIGQTSNGSTKAQSLGRGDSIRSRLACEPPRRLRLKTWQWGMAICLLLATGVVSYFALVGDDHSPSNSSHKIVVGTVQVNGVETTQISDNATLEVVGKVPAVIQLTDGSRVELSPGAIATIRGQVGDVRQVVVLHRNSGRFFVEKGEGQFRVETLVGSITALGTEFTVDLLSNKATTPDTLNSEHKAAFVVGVITGQVEVDYANEIFSLTLGDDRIFTSSLRTPSDEPNLIGKVVAVSDDLRSIRIEMKRPEHPQQHATVKLKNNTEFSWVNIPSDHHLPRLGYQASVWLDDNRDAHTASFVRFSIGEESSIPPPSLTGHVVHVKDHGRTIILQLSQHTKTKSSSPTRLVKIDEQTEIDYFFVRFDNQQPTAGYNATIWLQPNSTDIARSVHFSGNKRGDYRPDLSGRVVSVEQHGHLIKVEHLKRESIFHLGVNVTRTSLHLGRQVKQLYRDLPPAEQQPTVGYYAEIWMKRDSPGQVEAVRFNRRHLLSHTHSESKNE